MTARGTPLLAFLGAADVSLLAVEDVGLLLFVPRRERLDRAEVGAATGLGRVDAGERLAGGHGGKHFLLELLGAVAVDHVRPADRQQRVDRRAHRQVGARDLVHGDHRVDEALVVGQRHAAVLLGDRHAEDAELGHAGRDVGRDPVLGLVDGPGARLEVLGEPLPDRLAVEVLFGRVPELHVLLLTRPSAS